MKRPCDEVVDQALKRIRARAPKTPLAEGESCCSKAYNVGYNKGAAEAQELLFKVVQEEMGEVQRRVRALALAECEEDYRARYLAPSAPYVLRLL